MKVSRRRLVLVASVAVLGVVAVVGVVALMAGDGQARRAVPIEDFSPARDGRTLAVRYVAPELTCAASGGVVIRSQTATEVRLEAFAEYRADEDGEACLLAGRLVTAEVSLDQALGTRRVVDASSDRSLPVTAIRSPRGPSTP